MLIPHAALVNNLVHIFVDDQNIWIEAGKKSPWSDYRIDFGELLNIVSQDENKKMRPVRQAMIAGTIPPDDSFWDVARDQGFTVKLGYRGFHGKSKQDDHHITADIVETVCEQPGPSTIVLVAGDGDYGPALEKVLARGWCIEVCYVEGSLSPAVKGRAHRLVKLNPADIGR